MHLSSFQSECTRTMVLLKNIKINLFFFLLIAALKKMSVLNGRVFACLFILEVLSFLKMFFRLEREEGAASTSLMNILTLRYFTSSLTGFFHPIISLPLSLSLSVQIRVSADHAGPPLPSGVPLPPPAAPGAHLPDHLAQHEPRPLAAPSCCRLPQRR